MEAIAVKRNRKRIDSEQIFDKSNIQNCEIISLNEEDPIYLDVRIQKLKKALSFVSKARRIIYEVYPLEKQINENTSFIASIRDTENFSSLLIKAFSKAIGDLVAEEINKEFHNK